MGRGKAGGLTCLSLSSSGVSPASCTKGPMRTQDVNLKHLIAHHIKAELHLTIELGCPMDFPRDLPPSGVDVPPLERGCAFCHPKYGQELEAEGSLKASRRTSNLGDSLCRDGAESAHFRARDGHRTCGCLRGLPPKGGTSSTR